MSGLALLAFAVTSWSQETLEAKFDPSGMIDVFRGEVRLATIDLNAHGPGWKIAQQKSGKAEAKDLPEQAGKQFVGAFEIPGTEGGALKYTETVRALSQGFRLEYDLSVAKAMKLNGLQLSLYLPVAPYGGKEILISRPTGEPTLVGLPKEAPEEGRSLLPSGAGSKIEAAKGTDDAVTLELLAATDVVVQDLRQWGTPAFEIRFPAIMQDPGRDMSLTDRFHLELTITFASPVRLKGP